MAEHISEMPKGDKTFASVLSGEAQEFLYSSIIKSCTEYAIIAVEDDLKITLWNEGASRLFLYEAEEMLGTLNLINIHNPEDVQSGKLVKIFEQARQSGLWSGELKCLRKDAQAVCVLYTVTIRTNSLGRPSGFTIISHDQTEFSRQIQTLKESKEYTRSLIESNIDVLITTDSLGIINDVNR